MTMSDGLNCDSFVMELQFRHLVDSALLEQAEMSSGEVSIHDLYREFASLEAQGKVMALDMEERRWVYAIDALPTELEEEPRNSWKKLTRVWISGIRSLTTIEWKYCTNLVVLKLHFDYGLSGVLNLKDLIRLRSLSVRAIRGLSECKFSIEGLEGLKSLTYFKMRCDYEDLGAYVGQLPPALTVLDVIGPVVIERDVLALCTNLVSLKLWSVYTLDLDLRICTSLEKVELTTIKALEIVRLGPNNLQLLDIGGCMELVEVCGLDRLVGLLELDLTWNEKLLKLPNLTALKCLHTLFCSCLDIDEVPGLEGLVGVKSLTLCGCKQLSKLPTLTGLQCLRELNISNLGITEIPNLNGLEQLEVINASRNSELTSLQGLGDLCALTDLNLRGCKSLCWLSDMNNLTNLKVLDLRGTRVEFHEEDIHMLEGLQALEPVLVNYHYDSYGLDFKRHKIMYGLSEEIWDYKGWQTWKKSWPWEEKYLHYPSVDGYLLGKGFEMRHVQNIWSLTPGPSTKISGRCESVGDGKGKHNQRRHEGGKGRGKGSNVQYWPKAW